MKSHTSILPSVYAFLTIGTLLPTNVYYVQASSIGKLWKQITFFTTSNGSMINETMSSTTVTVDIIQPSPVVVEEDEDEVVCPTLQGDILCTADWFPVKCGPNNCQYSNDCHARGSGFNVTTDCQSVDDSGGGTIEEAFACPTLQPELVCSAHWDPFECGPNKCVYGNNCEAVGAGFNLTTNCTYIGTPHPTSTPITSTVTTTNSDCPTLPPDIFCEESWEPLLCADDCKYSNSCYASASGFNVASDCVPVAE